MALKTYLSEKEEEKGNIKRELLEIINEIEKSDLQYEDLEKLSQKIEGARQVLAGQIDSLKREFEIKSNDLKEYEKILEKENVNLENSPFKEKILLLQDLVNILLEAKSWLAYKARMFELYSLRASKALEIAKGLSLQKEVIKNTQEFIETQRNKDIEVIKDIMARKEEVYEQERKMQYEAFQRLIDTIRWNNEIVERMIKVLEKYSPEYANELAYLAKTKYKNTIQKREEEPEEQEELEEEDEEDEDQEYFVEKTPTGETIYVCKCGKKFLKKEYLDKHKEFCTAT